jgi:hypothetical protein
LQKASEKYKIPIGWGSGMLEQFMNCATAMVLFLAAVIKLSIVLSSKTHGLKMEETICCYANPKECMPFATEEFTDLAQVRNYWQELREEREDAIDDEGDVLSKVLIQAQDGEKLKNLRNKTF